MVYERKYERDRTSRLEVCNPPYSRCTNPVGGCLSIGNASGNFSEVGVVVFDLTYLLKVN